MYVTRIIAGLLWLTVCSLTYVSIAMDSTSNSLGQKRKED